MHSSLFLSWQKQYVLFFSTKVILTEEIYRNLLNPEQAPFIVMQNWELNRLPKSGSTFLLCC